MYEAVTAYPDNQLSELPVGIFDSGVGGLSVLKALRTAKINVVAIHQHMTGEQPRVMFLHYWGIGRTTDLATGLTAALAKTGKSTPSPSR